MEHELIAAVDLGSNSFRLQVGRVINDQVYPQDGLKESVRLAAGLSSSKMLSDKAQQRGLAALRRFNERLRDFDASLVRAVATNTLRVAKNADVFLKQAEQALGFPIEVIGGREEARLIYAGVAHSLPNPQQKQLVVDIGGGSTEIIIGCNFEPLALESLYMGCVSYSLRFFPGNRIDKRSLKEAELAAGRELQVISYVYRKLGWDLAVGSSGSAKCLVEVFSHNGWSDGVITRGGMENLRSQLLRNGRLNSLAGLRSDRVSVFLGGFAIMSAIFNEFDLAEMCFSNGALRLGVLYDLRGRRHHQDMRDATVDAFMQRYGVSQRQASNVANTACYLLVGVSPSARSAQCAERRFLHWAAMLHEIGVSIAHSGYHRHSGYIISNADMPGFSRQDQQRLACIVLGHRGKLARAVELKLDATHWQLLVCLRLAFILHRARDDRGIPPVRFKSKTGGFALDIQAAWLAQRPLTEAALREELVQWQRVGLVLQLDCSADAWDVLEASPSAA